MRIRYLALVTGVVACMLAGTSACSSAPPEVSDERLGEVAQAHHEVTTVAYKLVNTSGSSSGSSYLYAATNFPTGSWTQVSSAQGLPPFADDNFGSTTPTAVSNEYNAIDIFFLNINHEMIHVWTREGAFPTSPQFYSTESWGGLNGSLGRWLYGTPGVARNPDAGTIEVYSLAQNLLLGTHHVVRRVYSYSGGLLTNWQTIATVTPVVTGQRLGVSAVSWGGARTDVFALSMAGGTHPLLHMWSDNSGTSWSSETWPLWGYPWGGIVFATAAAGSRLDLFYGTAVGTTNSYVGHASWDPVGGYTTDHWGSPCPGAPFYGLDIRGADVLSIPLVSRTLTVAASCDGVASSFEMKASGASVPWHASYPPLPANDLNWPAPGTVVFFDALH